MYIYIYFFIYLKFDSSDFSKSQFFSLLGFIDSFLTVWLGRICYVTNNLKKLHKSLPGFNFISLIVVINLLNLDC